MSINKKIAFKTILIVLISLSIISCLGIKSQIRHHSGLNTEVVDASQFKTLFGKYAITHVNVLSIDSQSMQQDLTVLINKDKIESVGKNISIPHIYKIIDGSGQYLIPGLVDTHVHLKKSKNDLLQYLVNGVTHIATMNSWDELYLKWRQEEQMGALSPKIYVSAGGMSTKKGLMPKIRYLFGSSKGYNTARQAKKAVKEFKDLGYDAIKSYNLSKEVYFAVSNEAKKQNIPMIGHLTPSASLDDLFQSNQSQLAHVEEITKATMRDFGGRRYIFKNNNNIQAYLTYLKKNADNIAIKFKENNIVVSTTIWLIESIVEQDTNLPNFLKTIELEYMNPGIVEGSKFSSGWLPGSNRYENLNNTSPEEIKRSKVYWHTYVEALHIMTKALVRNGAIITAGTDANTAGTIAGFSLHDELQSLNNIGLTNAQVLHVATLAPAQWMKSNTGKIEAGFRADLILLAKNPLEDIKNTKTINAVITNGKYLDRKELDKILEAIKQANYRSREVNIDEYIN
jgi:hypothetical protein